MPTRTWPPDFPQIIMQNSYSETVGSQLQRSQPTTGPALVRRKAGKYPDIIYASVTFGNRTEYLKFRTWVNNVEEGLAGGLYVFSIKHPDGDGYINVRIVPQSDTDLYSVKPWDPGHVWEVTLTLEVMP